MPADGRAGHQRASSGHLRIGRTDAGAQFRVVGYSDLSSHAQPIIGALVERKASPVTGFRVGLADLLICTGLGPMAMTRANYLAAAATRIDSFWVPDHLNALMPRPSGPPSTSVPRARS